MTMKTKKTLQHIAAVAVVLLTLCLVFAVPVSAEGVSCQDGECNHVAVVNGLHYSKLADAIAVGGEVKVLGDVTLDTNLEIRNDVTLSADKEVTITAPKGINVYSGTTTLGKNLIINSDSFYLVVETGGKAIIDGASLKNSANYCVVSVKEGSSLTVKSGIIESTTNSAIIATGDKAVVTIEGGEVKTSGYDSAKEEYYCAVFARGGGLAEVKGGTVSSAGFYALVAVTDGTVKVSDGTVMGVLAHENDGASAYITGGTITDDVAAKNGASMTVNGGTFTDLVNATKYAAEGATIKLAEDVSLTEQLEITKKVKIVGDAANKPTITSAAKKIFNVSADAEFENLILKNSYSSLYGRCIDTRVDGIAVTITNCELVAEGTNSQPLTIGGYDIDGLTVTLSSTTINAGNSGYGIISFVPVTLTIQDASVSAGYGSLYFKDGSDGSTVSVSKSTLESTNTHSPPTNDFGTIIFEGNSTTVNVIDSTVKAEAKGTANQSIVLFSDSTVPNNNNKVTFTGGELVLIKGVSPASAFVYDVEENTGNSVVINAGVTANFNPSAYIAGGMEVVQPGDKYLVQKYVDRSSSSSSSSTTEPEEPEQPEEPVVEPETPAAPGEVTVETEVTDGGEVELETPAAEGEGGSAAADEDEAKIIGVVLPTGTDSEVTFVPVSEQPAPAGQEENTKKVFEINVPTYEKGKAAVIKFQMTVAELAADGKEAADVALWHFDEETGEWTKLVTSYTIVDGVVYFEAITEDFSPFAIIYEDEPSGDMPGNEPQDKPETPESPAPVLGLLAALGAAVVLRRK